MNRRFVALALSLPLAVGIAVAGPSVAASPLTDSTGRFAGEARVGNTLTSEGAFNTASDAACMNDINFQGFGSYTVPASQLGRYVFVNILGTGRGDCVGPIADVAQTPPIVVPPAPVAQPSVVDIYRVKPVSGSISVRNTITFYATVNIGGKPAPVNTEVQGFAKSKFVVTGLVNSSGKVKLTLPGKLPLGKSTLKIVLPASPTVLGSTDSVAVRVTKK